MSVFAIDPGTERSAFVLFEGRKVLEHGIVPNGELLETLVTSSWPAVVLEQIESFGMAVGREVFETVFWTGRFFEAAHRSRCDRVERLPRRAVKLHLCHSARATDASIRMAICDLFGGSAAIGTKKAQGPLYGIKSHEWAALAIAITWTEERGHHGASESKEVDRSGGSVVGGS